MPEIAYDHNLIELKWHQRWKDDAGLYKADPDSKRPKYYVLEMLPYPSGSLHIGHLRNYAIGDALARYKWMQGFNVLHPMGWDAFGLPAENAAIANHRDPHEWTLTNIAEMKRQHSRMAFSYDWDREVTTCEPDYYRWNQWFFLKMLERGLAYRKKALVNWCPECGTVLANEQVVDGCCWRHENTQVEQRALEQWFWKITDYAEELLRDIDEKLEGNWPDRVLAMQRNWIGRSEGSEIDFRLEGSDKKIRVFTTRVDTIYGATAVILAPEHPIAQELLDEAGRARAKQMIDARSKKGPGDVDKEGAPTGHFAINPYNGAKVPIWIGNFVLMDYGTGAIMAVPAHDERDFEFATTYDLPIVPVVRALPYGEAGHPPTRQVPHEALPVATPPDQPPKLPFTDYGIVENSGEYSGLTSADAKRVMNQRAEKDGFGKAAITYRIKDWGISRQRYWGTPIPVIHCPKCGVVPVPEKDLPVVLPLNVKIGGKGKSPLLDVPEFMNVKCPQCGGEGRRESDTMDTFVDSSWYFYRYCDPHNDKAPFDSKKIKYWFEIDQYIGGIEHAILHLIYSRFFTKVMRDIGLIENSEPARRMFNQGMVIKDGAKMSKSKGNVVSLDEMVERFGADTGRLFELFAAPPEKDMDWTDSGAEGAYRFLSKVFRFVTRNADRETGPGDPAAERKTLRKLHQTIKKITGDFDQRWHFNTSIAALMELINMLYQEEANLSRAALDQILPPLVLLLGPFAPYVAEEMWEQIGRQGPVFRQPWPKFDEEMAKEEAADVVLQVNGKVRGRLSVPFGTSQTELETLAMADAKVQSFVAGKQIVKIVVVPDKLVNIVVK